MGTSTLDRVELWKPVSARALDELGVKPIGWYVSDLGRVMRDGLLVEPICHKFTSKAGRETFQPAIEFAPGVTVLLTTLVAEAFIPNPHGSRSVMRKIKDPSNTRVENLEWRLRNQTSRKQPTPAEANLPNERWVPIQGALNYQVSDMGRVRKDGRPLRPLIKRWGEPTVFLYYSGQAKGALVSRLVANAFVPNPMGHVKVSRREGSQPRSCRAADLVWVTDGSPRRGVTKHRPYRKLTAELAREARARCAAGEKQKDVAADFARRGCKVTPTAISFVITGKTWRGV